MASRSKQTVNLGRLFMIEEDLIAKVASFCGLKSLTNLSQTCKTCSLRCQPELERRKIEKQKYFKPRTEGKCRVYWESDTGHRFKERWVGKHHGPGKWVEVCDVETLLGKKLEDLHACDLVQLNGYRGTGTYCAVVREGRLVLIKTGNEYGYMLPPDAYEAGEKFGYFEYYEDVIGCDGFILYAALPDDCSVFRKHVASRPSADHHLFASFLSEEEPASFSGDLSVDSGDDVPLYWARNCDDLINW